MIQSTTDAVSTPAERAVNDEVIDLADAQDPFDRSGYQEGLDTGARQVAEAVCELLTMGVPSDVVQSALARASTHDSAVGVLRSIRQTALHFMRVR